MAHGQGQTSTKRGGYGALARGSRGHGKDKAVKKAEQRARDPRWQEAMEQVRKEREELDRLIEQQKAEPALGAAAGALIDAQIKAQKENLEKAQAEEARIEAEQAESQSEVTEKEGDAKGWPEAPVAGFRQPLSEVAPTETKSEVIESDQTGLTGLPITFVERKFNKKNLRKVGDGHWQFAHSTALIMLRQGYHIEHVLEFTGVGYEDLQNIELDEEGYGVREGADEIE